VSRDEEEPRVFGVDFKARKLTALFSGPEIDEIHETAGLSLRFEDSEMYEVHRFFREVFRRVSTPRVGDVGEPLAALIAAVKNPYVKAPVVVELQNSPWLLLEISGARGWIEWSPDWSSAAVGLFEKQMYPESKRRAFVERAEVRFGEEERTILNHLREWRGLRRNREFFPSDPDIFLFMGRVMDFLVSVALFQRLDELERRRTLLESFVPESVLALRATTTSAFPDDEMACMLAILMCPLQRIGWTEEILAMAAAALEERPAGPTRLLHSQPLDNLDGRSQAVFLEMRQLRRVWRRDHGLFERVSDADSRWAMLEYVGGTLLDVYFSRKPSAPTQGEPG
jgi:hypothetical protein